MQPRKKVLKAGRSTKNCSSTLRLFSGGVFVFRAGALASKRRSRMRVFWNPVPPVPALGGAEGELVSIRLFVVPHLLEDLLEALASVSFPVNPQIHHRSGHEIMVEFPAYSGRLPDVVNALTDHGFDAAGLVIRPMLAELATALRNSANPN
ncbi:MAG: hypothetical protein ABI693_07485 [Bryobacteraceae bacterium]